MIINKKSFTLVELLLVIAIIGILSVVVLVSLSSSRARARDARRINDLAEIKTALELYKEANGTYQVKMKDGTGTGGWGGGCNFRGYFNYQDTSKSCVVGASNYGTYGNSIARGLEDWGYFNPAPKDPLKPTGYEGYMYWVSNDGLSYSIYAKLEKPKNLDADGYDGSSSPGSTCQSHWPAAGASTGCLANYRIGNGG